MNVKRYGIEGRQGAGGQHLPFARTVEADGWLYVSGQVPLANGALVAGSIVVQARQAIENLLSMKRAMAPSMWCGAACGSMTPAIFRHSIKCSRNILEKIRPRALVWSLAWSSIAR